jgi:hypothetical protein
MARTGTVARLFAVCLVLLAAACSASHDRARTAADDAQVVALADAAARDAASDPDAGPSASPGCTTDEQCALVPRGCCGCGPTLDSVRAVHVDDEASAQAACAGVQCGECQPRPHDPLAAWPAPTCVAGQCTVRDLRRAEETRCTNDGDCQLSPAQRSCCGACSSDPHGWQALRKGATVHLAGHGCAGDVVCWECELRYPPTIFCATDGHCAVRATPAIDGTPSPACFAPGYRAETAMLPEAQGCDCFPADPDVCDPVAGALFCRDGSWQPGFDGPCWIQ